MSIQATASRKDARNLAKKSGGVVKDLQPPRKILTLNGLSGKNAPKKPGEPRWIVGDKFYFDYKDAQFPKPK